MGNTGSIGTFAAVNVDLPPTERQIRRVLRALARQRVAVVLQPGNVWGIEGAIDHSEGVDTALKTCYMRGWVEPITNAIPRGQLTPDGRMPSGNLFTSSGPMYRVTEGGWAVINRSHHWTLIAVALSALSFVVAIVSVLVAVLQSHH